MNNQASQHDVLLTDAQTACWMAALHLSIGDVTEANQELSAAIWTLHDRTLVLREDVAGELPLSGLAQVSLS